jgi:hypothetical protein
MKKLVLKLDTKSINETINELNKYRSSLRSKSEQLVNRLLDEGIKVAYQHVGKYTGYVEFTKDVQGGTEVVGILTGKDTQPFISTWKVKGGEKTAEVSGILMSEFGSGWLANVIWNVSGVGQGTFPGQTHATDPNGWFWEDLNGHKHHSIGETPQYPMYSADMTMLSQIDTIAREVFNGI